MSMWQTARTQYLLNQVALSNSIRRIMVSNNQWIRALIFSILYGRVDQQAIEQRLVQNANELGMLFAQFYGQETGNRVRDNYLTYLQNLGKMIEAYRDNDLSAVATQRKRLNQNANSFAQLLSGINRYWDLAALEALIAELVNLAESQILRIMSGEFTQSIQEYDEFMNQAYRLSDELTTGMLRQFQV